MRHAPFETDQKAFTMMLLFVCTLGSFIAQVVGCIYGYLAYREAPKKRVGGDMGAGRGNDSLGNLDLGFKGYFCTLYHGKSSSNHHLRQYVLLVFPASDMQMQVFHNLFRPLRAFPRQRFDKLPKGPHPSNATWDPQEIAGLMIRAY